MRLHNFLIAAALCVLTLSCSHNEQSANTLTILQTNDTHSQIDPDNHNLGGVMRRMAIIDSVRNADPNVMLVDAGDVVQGTLYFYLYGGKVEQEMMNAMGLDLGILGNHEFDNGIDSLATILNLRNSKMIASNYKLEDTPLAARFDRYDIREIGGRKVGFMGINLDPDGMISEGNARGIEFMPVVETANAMAAELRQMGADEVIALTHIGYNPAGLVGDSVLAKNSRGIDIIIGGHSHDVIDPSTEVGAARSRMTNADGKNILVVQTGKAGRNLGKIKIDLDNLDAEPEYELIPVTSAYDSYNNPAIAAVRDRYYPGVDSLMHLWVGTTAEALPDSSVRLLNWFSDWVLRRGKELAPNVDLAIVNKGGLRASLPQGQFSKGHVINMLPFRNLVTVVDVKGDDLEDIFDVMAGTRGNGVSDNVRATYENEGDNEYDLGTVTIDGRPIDENRTYRVATIDYLANGGDYMKAFKRGTVVAASPDVLYDDLLYYLTVGEGKDVPVAGSPVPRWAETVDD